jgi:AcrR family transcriptional regulator
MAARITSGHRPRLIEAMAEVAARYGYGGASVARVVERAGVSRATFYEHFSDREDCFLASYRVVVERVRRRLSRAAGAPTAGVRMSGLLEALLDWVGEDATGARLLLIEAFGSPVSVRREHERVIVAAESALERLACRGAPDEPVLQLPVKALLSGIVSVLSARLLRRAPVSTLGDELLAWISSYALAPSGRRWQSHDWEALERRFPAAGAPTAAGAPSLLPRGRGALTPELAGADRCDRIVAATARVIRAEGYERATVAGIVSAARVTRGAFYAHFRGKRDAFLAAQTVALRESIAAAAAEYATGATWPERVWDGLGALLDYMAENPDLAYAGVVEVQAVGEPAILRAEDTRLAYALFLEDGYRQRPVAASLPRICSEAVAGAILGLLRHRIAAGQVRRLPEALPVCAYVALVPFIGPRPATEFVVAKARVTAAAA